MKLENHWTRHMLKTLRLAETLAGVTVADASPGEASVATTEGITKAEGLSVN